MALTGFTTPWIGAGSIALCAIIALSFAGTATAAVGHRGHGRLLVAAVGPLLPGATLLLALVASLGPLGFWYRFWTSPILRFAFVTILIATPLWTAYAMLVVRVRDGWHGRVAGWLVPAGAALVVLTALLPDWAVAMRSLDRPLNLAPATETMVFALRTYAGVSLDGGRLSYVLGGACLIAGFAIWLRSPSPIPRAPADPPSAPAHLAPSSSSQ